MRFKITSIIYFGFRNIQLSSSFPKQKIYLEFANSSIFIAIQMTQTYSRISRPLFQTNRKSPSVQIESEDCHYCLIKKKFSGPNQKCLEHTITDNKSQVSAHSPSSQAPEAIIDHILELLLDVEDSLEDYWNNLYSYSQGNSQKVKNQLMPVHEAIKRVEEKLSKFPFEDFAIIEPVQKKRQHNDICQQEKKMATRSQKFITSNFSEIFDDITLNDQIKEWVIYFQKILVNKQIQQELLPLEEQIDMHIFKESMERKFLTFARNYDRYERRTGQALERLLFYMQNFGSQLNGDMLSKDLLFIQENQEAIRSVEESEFHKCIFIQALTIEHLLAQKQLEIQSTGGSRVHFEQI